MKTIGKRTWAIAEGYIPSWSHGPEHEMKSHETACILNAGDQDAHIRMMVFFSDREAAGPYEVTVPARRTKHVRFNDLRDPQPIPLATDFSSVIESDVPIVVQHTRLDSIQPARKAIQPAIMGKLAKSTNRWRRRGVCIAAWIVDAISTPMK